MKSFFMDHSERVERVVLHDPVGVRGLRHRWLAWNVCTQFTVIAGKGPHPAALVSTKRATGMSLGIIARCPGMQTSLRAWASGVRLKASRYDTPAASKSAATSPFTHNANERESGNDMAKQSDGE
jgi:hypothetical protein